MAFRAMATSPSAVVCTSLSSQCGGRGTKGSMV